MSEGIQKGHLQNANPIKVEMTTDNLAELIDSVIQAIDKSQLGPMIEYGGTPGNEKKIINPAAFSLFLQAFTTLLTMVDTVTLIPEKQSESGIIDPSLN